jgi:hypothetical protein
MPEYSGSGFLILATGSFFGEIGSNGQGEVFMNSHGKSKGIIFDGVESISASADGTIVTKKKFNKVTGLIIENKVKDTNTGKTFRRSGSATSNQIEFQQSPTAAFITVSGSSPGYNVIETSDSANLYSLWRSNFIYFMKSSVGWNVGQNTNLNFQINQGPPGNVSNTPTFEIRGTSAYSVHISGSTHIKGDTNVDGTFSATRKSFDIPHPSKPNKRLVYGSLEGPEFGVYIRGKVVGDNKIPFPDYWVDLVHMDTLSVHLTPINSEKSIYFTFSDNKYIYIKREAEFFYFVCAERKDTTRLQVEQ